MDQPMTQAESYAERRKLFKNIWETAMQIDDKDGEIINKPKVIKTLRLDEVDSCSTTKKKKQRLKNLRTVCNRILDFCDRQDADDLFYRQMASAAKTSPFQDKETCVRKVKRHKPKSKTQKAKSLLPTLNNKKIGKPTISEYNEHLSNVGVTKTSRNTSPFKIKRTSLTYTTNKKMKLKQRTVKSNQIACDPESVHKVLKKIDRPADLHFKSTCTKTE